MFTIKRGRLNPLFKSMSQQVRCPTCNRRFFDGMFVGVLEIICPRCGDAAVVTCQTPDNIEKLPGTAATASPSLNGHNENGVETQEVSATFLTVPAQ